MILATVIFAVLVLGLCLWLAVRGTLLGAGFAALGGSAGMMIGLSTSPVVGTAVGAVLGVLALAIPVYFQKVAPEALKTTATEGVPPLGSWLFPFAAAVFLGIPLGLALRVNNALDFSSSNLRKHYEAQGFTQEQIDVLMDRHTKGGADFAPPPISRQPTVLHTAVRPANFSKIWRDTVNPDDPPDENLRRLQVASPKDVQAMIESLKRDNHRSQDILTALKDQWKP